eukprot:g56157.t1
MKYSAKKYPVQTGYFLRRYRKGKEMLLSLEQDILFRTNAAPSSQKSLALEPAAVAKRSSRLLLLVAISRL